MAWKRCPNSVKSTIFTAPAGPLGESLGSAHTRLTRESGKIDAYLRASLYRHHRASFDVFAKSNIFTL